MVRTFRQAKKQVADRVAGRPPKGGPFVGMDAILTYLFELKTFHVKQLEIARGIGGDDALHEHEKNVLAAGEHFEEAIKAWLAGT